MAKQSHDTSEPITGAPKALESSAREPTAWMGQPPLADAWSVGRRGRADGTAGVRVALGHAHRIAEILLMGPADFGEVVAALRSASGPGSASRPAAAARASTVHPGFARDTGDLTIVTAGARRLIALSRRRAFENGEIGRALNVTANAFAISEQTGSRVELIVAGPRATEAFAKLCSLDLDPQIFTEGRAATTHFAHVPALLWRGARSIDGTPTYHLLAPQSFAQTLWHDVQTAADMYGVEVL